MADTIYPKTTTFIEKESLQFASDFVKVSDVANLEELHLKPQRDRITMLLSSTKGSYKSATEGELTEQLRILDIKRDNIIVYIEGELRAQCKHWIDEIALRAQTVYSRWERHGKRIYELGYRPETITVEAVCNEFLGDEALVAEITSFNLYDSFVALSTANNKFSEVTLERTRIRSEQENGELADAIAMMLKEIRQFYVNTDSLASVFTTLDYSELKAVISALAAEYNEIANRRLAIKAANKEEE